MKKGTTVFCAALSLCFVGMLPSSTAEERARLEQAAPAAPSAAVPEVAEVPQETPKSVEAAAAAPPPAALPEPPKQKDGAQEPPPPSSTSSRSELLLVDSDALTGARLPSPTPFNLADLASPERVLRPPWLCAQKLLVSPKADKAKNIQALQNCLKNLPSDEMPRPEERYVEAIALWRTGRVSLAAEKLEALADRFPALRDRCHYLAGKAFASVGQEARASQSFQAISPDSGLSDDAVLAAASAHRRLKHFDAALSLLQPLAVRPRSPWGRDVAAEAIYARAEILRQLGKNKAAAASFLEVWSAHPRSYLAPQALKDAHALKVDPTPEVNLVRAESLAEIHRNDAALSLVMPMLKRPPKDVSAEMLCRARSVAGRTQRKLRRFKDAVETLKPVRTGCAPSEAWAASMYALGTSASAGIDVEMAEEVYAELERRMPRSGLADDALFLASGIAERRGHFDEARRYLRRIALLHEDADHRAEALFRLAWISRKDGLLSDAKSAFAQLEREYADRDPEAAIRAGYWKARTLEDMGQTEASRAALRSLAEAHPAGFYALLARTRLSGAEEKEKGTDKPQDSAGAQAAAETADVSRVSLPLAAPPPAESFQTRLLTENDRFQAALALLSMGFVDDGIQELLKINRAPLRYPVPPDDLMALSVLLSASGDRRRAHVIARNDLKGIFYGSPSPDHLSVWKVSWPELFREPIEARADGAGIDADLLQALVREESAFKPTAGSWAGAMGLCQLMMPTAKEVAGWLKIPGRITRERLLNDPDLNLWMGATYLSRLIRQFKGNTALAVAAYNAGAGSVRRFLNRYPGVELDEFVEEIPFEETRLYVKHVLGSMATYQLVYGRSPAPTLASGVKLDREELGLNPAPAPAPQAAE